VTQGLLFFSQVKLWSMPQRIRTDDSQPHLADSLGTTSMFVENKNGRDAEAHRPL
jgi:hypothetical protein